MWRFCCGDGVYLGWRSIRACFTSGLGIRMIVCVGQWCSGVGTCWFWCCCGLVCLFCCCAGPSVAVFRWSVSRLCFACCQCFGWVSYASEIWYGFPNCRAITSVICGSCVWFFVFRVWRLVVLGVRVYPALVVFCFRAFLVHLVWVLLNKIVLFQKKNP